MDTVQPLAARCNAGTVLAGHRHGDHAEEVVLIARIRAGDTEAAGALYQMHGPAALAFARSLSRSDQDAEDILHEAFTKTLSALGNGFGPSENFLAYLHAAVRATAARWWRRNTREQPVGPEDLECRPDPHDHFESVLDSPDQRVLAALQSLPKRWQTALWYADVLQEKPRHIAPLMGIAPNAVSALVRRARKGLREAYLNSGSETDVDGMHARVSGTG